MLPTPSAPNDTRSTPVFPASQVVVHRAASFFFFSRITTSSLYREFPWLLVLCFTLPRFASALPPALAHIPLVPRLPRPCTRTISRSFRRHFCPTCTIPPPWIFDSRRLLLAVPAHATASRDREATRFPSLRPWDAQHQKPNLSLLRAELRSGSAKLAATILSTKMRFGPSTPETTCSSSNNLPPFPRPKSNPLPLNPGTRTREYLPMLQTGAPQPLSLHTTMVDQCGTSLPR